jgi:drug/metabolite transporter (DMT)-like permease
LRTRAVRNLVLCTVFLALSFPVMRALAFTQAQLLPDGGSWFFTALGVMYRFGFAGLILVPLFWRSLRTLTGRELEQGMLLAGFGVGGILLQMDGLTYTDASISAFLTQGYCVFIPVLVALKNRKLPAVKTMLCIALVVIGTAILAKLNLQSFKLGRGEMETILASFFFTGQILALEGPRYAANRAANFSIVMFFCMAFLALPLVLVTMPAANACLRAYASVPACGLMALLVVFCTLISYTVMNYWQKYISATEAGLIYTIEPVCASLLSLFLPAVFSTWAAVNYPNEHFSMRLMVGGGLITAANVLLQIRWLEKKS